MLSLIFLGAMFALYAGALASWATAVRCAKRGDSLNSSKRLVLGWAFYAVGAMCAVIAVALS